MNASPTRWRSLPRRAAAKIAAGAVALLTAATALAATDDTSADDASTDGSADDSAADDSAADDSAADDSAADDSAAEAFDPLGEPVTEQLSRLGLMFDLGTVDGGMLSLVYRPSPWLRVHGGGGTNGAAPGLRAGASVAPFRQRGLAFSLDAGHFFPGDINGIFSAFAGASYDDSRLLEDFDYNFVNLQAGWEVERSGLMFFVRGGVAFVWAQVPARGLTQIPNLSSLVDPDGSVEAFLPSLRVGLIGFL